MQAVPPTEMVDQNEAEKAPALASPPPPMSLCRACGGDEYSADRRSLAQEIVGALRSRGHWCPDTAGPDLISALGLALDRRAAAEPPVDSDYRILVYHDTTGATLADVRRPTIELARRRARTLHRKLGHVARVTLRGFEVGYVADGGEWRAR